MVPVLEADVSRFCIGLNQCSVFVSVRIHLFPILEQAIGHVTVETGDKTTIFVSHRLSSATVASKIAVLEYGRLIEEGDHKTLMAMRGRYFELFSTQARRYVMEDDERADAGMEQPSPTSGQTHRAPPDGAAPRRGMPPPSGHIPPPDDPARRRSSTRRV